MTAPEWLDRAAYPFDSHYLDLPTGRVHYVDEGQGQPILMVHGTPTWSFLYRHLIKGLSQSHRVVAPDMLGFGLSDKPEDAAYRPADHARNLETLIERLELRNVVLAVHDFGGPIGLSYAIEQPQNVAGLLLFNTWMWSLQDHQAARRASSIMGGPIGKFLYKRLNFSPKVLIKAVYGDKRKLTRQIHQHYIQPFAAAAERQAPWVFARELIGSSAWYDQLWQRRERIRHLPALLLWGMRDPTFGAAELQRWSELFDNTTIETFPDAGHFVQEEQGQELLPIIERFLAQHAQVSVTA